MTKARSSLWLNDRATLLATLVLQRHSKTISEDAARQDISDHVAAIKCVGRRAAKMCVTDDVIDDMANRIAAFVDQHPAPPRRRPTRNRLVDLDEERRHRRP